MKFWGTKIGAIALKMVNVAGRMLCGVMRFWHTSMPAWKSGYVELFDCLVSCSETTCNIVPSTKDHALLVDTQREGERKEGIGTSLSSVCLASSCTEIKLKIQCARYSGLAFPP